MESHIYRQHGLSGRSHANTSNGRSASSHTPMLRKIRTIPPALGPRTERRLLDQVLTNQASNDEKISNCEFIASYTLLEGLQKTIFVPGLPPVWTPLPGSVKLQPDSGTYYRDENAARFPDHHLEPAVHSIRVMSPSLDHSAIDVFACGSTLGDLLRFARGTPQPFSFVVHVPDGAQTAFFLRRHHSPTELIDGVYGYGHTFPETYTTWKPDVAGSASHQRIISYTFAGMRVLMRFEADGYITEQADELSDQGKGPEDGEDDDENDDDDDDNNNSKGEPPSPFQARSKDSANSNDLPYEKIIDELTQKLGLPSTLSATLSGAGPSNTSKLQVLRRGLRVSQSAIFDLKTRSSTKPRRGIMAEEIPRLWVRQIQNFVLAFHTRGVFKEPVVQDVSSDIARWEQETETALKKMSVLMREICDLARKAKGRKIEVRGGEGPELNIHAVEGEDADKWNALPEDLEKWWTSK